MKDVQSFAELKRLLRDERDVVWLGRSRQSTTTRLYELSEGGADPTHVLKEIKKSGSSCPEEVIVYSKKLPLIKRAAETDDDDKQWGLQSQEYHKAE